MNTTISSSGFQVTLEKASFVIPGLTPRTLIDNISLKVLAGSFVAIVGENGAGKSTLLSLISGEKIATQGSVCVAGELVNKPINRIIDGVGVVHQADERDLIGHLSIAQNIYIRERLGSGASKRLVGVTQAWRRSTSAKLGALTKVKFPLDLLVSQLSGGERQILSILIATQFEHERNPCRLLLLDEHTSKLDHKKADEVMLFTKSQIEATGCTAIMVTHRYADAITYADRIVALGESKIIFDQPARKNMTVDELKAVVEKR